MSKTGPELFDLFKKHKLKIVIEGQTFYVVEGDLLLDEQQLLVYAFQRAEIEAAADTNKLAEERKGLVGIADDNGHIVRWKKGLTLTYAVLKNTFGIDQYKTVVDAMHIATAGWEAVCDVKFQHLEHWDEGGASQPQIPLFAVQQAPINNNLIALAFFPNEAVSRRKIYIYPTFFSPNLGYAKEGVLRHELGHVLGFRHEHIRSGAPPDCRDEPLDHTIYLTQYDPQSVMHYFCGGVGTREMAITELDRQGARYVYGPPDYEVTYCE